MKYKVFNQKAFDEMERYRNEHGISVLEMQKQTGISRIQYKHFIDNHIEIIRDTTQAKIIAFNQAHGLYTGKDKK